MVNVKRNLKLEKALHEKNNIIRIGEIIMFNWIKSLFGKKDQSQVKGKVIKMEKEIKKVEKSNKVPSPKAPLSKAVKKVESNKTSSTKSSPIKTTYQDDHNYLLNTAIMTSVVHSSEPTTSSSICSSSSSTSSSSNCSGYDYGSSSSSYNGGSSSSCGGSYD